MALTAKQSRFIDEYLVDLNATQAAIRAGYSPETAEQIGYQLLQKTSVKNAIAVEMAERSKRTGVTQDRVLREYARLAFFDPRKLFCEDGRPKDITELDDDTAAGLMGLDMQEVYEGSGEDREFVGYIKKYKLPDKKGALDSLGKHLGLFDGKGVGGPDKTNNLLETIQSGAGEEVDTDDLPEVQ